MPSVTDADNFASPKICPQAESENIQQGPFALHLILLDGSWQRASPAANSGVEGHVCLQHVQQMQLRVELFRENAEAYFVASLEYWLKSVGSRIRDSRHRRLLLLM